MRKNRKQERKVEADERQAKYDKLTVNQKIKIAESRMGNSEKELKRLRRKGWTTITK